MEIQTKTKHFEREGQLSLSTLRKRFTAFAFKRILFSKSAQDADLKKGDSKLERLLKIAS